MRKNNFLLGALLLCLCTGFVISLMQLWSLRFAVGNLYPAYSSLRADPLGVKAFYEALGHLPGLTVLRHYKRFTQLPAAATTTLLLLGLPQHYFDMLSDDERQALETFVRRGGRLVMAFAPVRVTPAAIPEETTADEPEQESKASPAAAEGWGVGIETFPFPAQQSTKVAVMLSPDNVGLPPEVPWYSTAVLQPYTSAWQVLYAREQRPVLMIRPLGEGSIVVCTDTYLFSNEALWGERHTDLLTWMLGAATTVLFDETHLGSREEAGVMTLLRKYRLHGALLGLLVLASLFLWKHTTSLVPPTAVTGETAYGEIVLGHSMLTGLANLLQRHVGQEDLLRVCFAEWCKSPQQESRRIAMQKVIAAHQGRSAQHLVDTYRTLCHIVQTKGM